MITFDIVRPMERGLKEYGFNVSAFIHPLLALEDIKADRILDIDQVCRI